MNEKRSREAAIAFLEYLAKKGLMAPATAQARKAAVNTVLSILDTSEAQDVTLIDLNSVMERFGNLQGNQYTPASLRAYKSRVKSALEDFASYVDNPLAFKPSLQTRERKATQSKSSLVVKKPSPTSPVTETSTQSVATVVGPMSSSILPIPIRADLTIHIQGLPFDLTEAEAKKIASVIQAMAM